MAMIPIHARAEGPTNPRAILPSPSVEEMHFCQVHDPHRIDSLRLFSESPAILHFWARRLSQHNLILSFPSPGRCLPLNEGMAQMDLSWHIGAECGH